MVEMVLAFMVWACFVEITGLSSFLLACLIARYHLLRFRFLLNCNSAIFFLALGNDQDCTTRFHDWEKHMHWAAAL